MNVSIAKLSKTAYCRLCRDPKALQGVLQGDDPLLCAALKLDPERDRGCFDFERLYEMLEACGELPRGEAQRAPGHVLGSDGELDYDAGYGRAFVLSPRAVKRAMKVGSFLIDRRIYQLVKRAANERAYVVGLISSSTTVSSDKRS